MSIHLYILVLITRSFLQKLTRKLFFHYLIFATSCTTKMQILILYNWFQTSNWYMFDGYRAFVNNNVNKKIFILNKTILNILSNSISHKTLTTDDKDLLGLQKKNLRLEKNNVYKGYQNCKNKNKIKYLRRLKLLQKLLTKLKFSNQIIIPE